MSRAHKIVTVERQGGYAARCEIEVDGEIHICDITFGGFPTRTAARAALVHEKALAPAATGDEGIDPTPEGEIMNTSRVHPTIDERDEPLAPIYGPNDPRWEPLRAWLVDNFDERTGLIEDLNPFERAHWHEHHVRGIDKALVWRRPVEAPPFPQEAPRPAWADQLLDEGEGEETWFPTGRWIREIATAASVTPAAIEQEVAFDPDSGEIVPQPRVLSVWLTGDGPVRFAEPDDARRMALRLLELADAYEAAIR